MTYSSRLPSRPLVWLQGEIKTPPFSPEARVEAGVLLRRLQNGEHLAMPHSRPMPTIGPRCHELRIRDRGGNWRIVYRLDRDAVIVGAVFAKTSTQSPRPELEAARRRFRAYDALLEG